MANIRVTSSIGNLASDMRTVTVEAKPTMARVVARNAKSGNQIAKGFARKSSGRHGVHYPDRFSAERITPLSWQYGPKGRPQGEMAFETGSRNSPGHYDLAKSADIAGHALAFEVGRDVDNLFWPS